MKCPNCSHELKEFSPFCENCNHVFQREEYDYFIEDYIDRYSKIPLKQHKTKQVDSKIIFKNVSSNNISQEHFNYSSPEEFAINFYKQNGYNAFFAENNYWKVLFFMICDYQHFIGSCFFYELLSSNIIPDQDDLIKINSLDFNEINNIENINNQIITAYFKSLKSRILADENLNIKRDYCGLRDNFSIDELLAPNIYLTKRQLKLIFERMGDDFKYYSFGLPDLIVYNDEEFFFVEVKSKSDKPTFKQIQWHKFLTEVVGIDVVLFMIDKSDEQILNIKKRYDIKLIDSKQRKTNFRESDNQISIHWNDDCLKQHIVNVSNDNFNKLIYLRRAYRMRYKKYVVNDYTHLSPDDFGDIGEWKKYQQIRWAKTNDFIFEKAKELYSSPSFEDYTPSQKQLQRNKKAKIFEDNGEYSKAVDLYMENVIEKTGSPTTYKRLVYILNKFDRFNDVVKLMDIAIPIFITLNDKTNALRFIAQRFAAMNDNKGVSSSETISSDTIKSKHEKAVDKQMDLSNYFK